MLTDNIQEFEKRNVKLLSIASDTNRLLQNFKDQNNFKVDMISDRGAKIAKDYGVSWFTTGFSNIKIKQAVPSKFLIDKNGIIVWKYIGRDKTDRPLLKMMMILMDKYITNPN